MSIENNDFVRWLNLKMINRPFCKYIKFILIKNHQLLNSFFGSLKWFRVSFQQDLKNKYAEFQQSCKVLPVASFYNYPTYIGLPDLDNRQFGGCFFKWNFLDERKLSSFGCSNPCAFAPIVKDLCNEKSGPFDTNGNETALFWTNGQILFRNGKKIEAFPDHRLEVCGKWRIGSIDGKSHQGKTKIKIYQGIHHQLASRQIPCIKPFSFVLYFSSRCKQLRRGIK